MNYCARRNTRKQRRKNVTLVLHRNRRKNRFRERMMKKKLIRTLFHETNTFIQMKSSIRKSEFNARRLFDFNADVENDVPVSCDKLFALRLAHLTTGSVHFLETWKCSPVPDRIKRRSCVSVVLMVTKPRQRNELDLQVVVDDERNTQAPFHVEMGDGAVANVLENLLVHDIRKISSLRNVQDFQLDPEGRWESPMLWFSEIPCVRFQDASFHAQVPHCRTSTEEVCEAHVSVAASLELECHQTVERFKSFIRPLSQPCPSRVRDP